MSHEPRVRIVMTAHGRGDVFVDGVKLQDVQRVEFESDAGADRPNLVKITLIAATVEIDSAVSWLHYSRPTAPDTTLEPCRWCGIPVREQSDAPADYCVHDGLWHPRKGRGL